MREYLFSCSSLGKLMTEPAAAAQKAGEVLSVGAKTYIRQLAAQEIFGIEFEVGSKAMEKGIRCEGDSIALLNRVHGLSLTKNTERRGNGLITGEADLVDTHAGYDLKTSWSASTFPITVADCVDKGYEWQMRGYMALWNLPRWHVAYALVDTPEDLIGYEPITMHTFGHIPEHHRITVWTVERDEALEASIERKVQAARQYMREVFAEFDRTHRPANAPLIQPPVQPQATKTRTAPADIPNLF